MSFDSAKIKPAEAEISAAPLEAHPAAADPSISNAKAVSSRLKIWAANLATLFGSLFLGVLAFEAVYLVFPFGVDPVLPADDRPTDYYGLKGSKLRSDFVHSLSKPEGVYRIVTVGDSFTYPTFMQFDDSYSKRLERILNLANPGENKAEVLNLGRMGLSTQREVAEIKRAIGYHPDLIILEITLNDAELHNFHQEQQKHPGKFSFGEYKVTPENHPLLSHFHGLSFLYERMHRIGSKNAVAEYYVNSFRDERNLQIFETSLDEIKAVADQAGVRLAVVIFPMFYTDIDDSYPFAEIHTILHNELDKRGLKYIDLRSAYTGIPHTRLNVIVGKDTHPNEIAHRIAADNIYRWLELEHLVPAELTAPIYKDVPPRRRRSLRNKQRNLPAAD